MKAGIGFFFFAAGIALLIKVAGVAAVGTALFYALGGLFFLVMLAAI